MSSLHVGIYLVVYLILLRLSDRGLENPVLLTGKFHSALWWTSCKT